MSFASQPFLEVIKDASGGNVKTQQKDYLSSGLYPIVDQGKDLIGGYTDEASRLCKVEPPVIVFGDHTRAVKYIDFPFAMGADGTKILVPKRGDDSRYLYHAIKAIKIEEAGYSRHFKFLKEARIPLPPLEEQKRIAKILDAADALRAKRRESLAQLDALLQSTFLDLFGDPRKNDRGFEMFSLKHLGTVVTGSTPPSKLPDMYGGEIPFITPGDLKESWLDASSRSLTAAGAQRSRLVDAGALLVCCIGATIGKMGKAKVRSAFNQQINAVDWNDKILPNYGLAVMKFYKDTIASEGASTTLPILKKSRFQEISVPVPSLGEQEKFSRIVDHVEMQAKVQQQHLNRLDELFFSLQQKAFSGEL